MPAPAPSFVNTLPRATRDPALDLIRGLAIAILVVNHLPFDSALEDATSGVLSAAEMLVCVSGVVAGMVFGRRWLTLGARRTSRMLLARARKLYLAPLSDVQAMLGHAHITTTMRYVHHRPGADDAARLSRAFRGDATAPLVSSSANDTAENT